MKYVTVLSGGCIYLSYYEKCFFVVEFKNIYWTSVIPNLLCFPGHMKYGMSSDAFYLNISVSTQ